MENGPTFQQLKESSVRCTLCYIFYKGLLACVPGICPSTIIGIVFSVCSDPRPRLVLETKAAVTQIEFFAVQGEKISSHDESRNLSRQLCCLNYEVMFHGRG